MQLPQSLIFLLLVTPLAFASRPAKRTYDTHNYYVIEHNPLIGLSLSDIVRALDVELVEQAGELKDHWLVRDKKPEIAARDLDSDSDRILKRFEHLRSLADQNIWSRSEDTLMARQIIDSVPMLERQVLRRRHKRAPPPITPPSARGVAQRFGIKDPLFPEQWHLVNDEYPEHMMNVTGVWEMGLTGKGVISSLVDDGLDYNALDLKDNFDAVDSHDFNDHTELPTPKNQDDHHGTRCAGQIAAGKNNYCGMGIAYESKVAGVRILSGPISDVDEAAALNYGFQNVSIYSCSWGPPDNGRAMAGPNRLIDKAVLNGINNGRGGKGSVFVFASGNGGGNGDQCNFDGYTNSIYSVTVSAVDYQGKHPYYSEACTANMIVAYSSGGGKHIVTTDIGENECSSHHGGTSAAAPNAAGVFALALQARPDLTWRDIQYLCVKTARPINTDESGWETTFTGHKYNNKYGFGVLDAYTFVKAAMDWKLVKPQAWFKTHTVILNGGRMTGTKKHKDLKYSGGQHIPPEGIKSTITVTESMLTDNNFDVLEHVQIKVWISHGARGDVEVEVVSPHGIKSILGGRRQGDKATTGYPGWTFMSVKHWGEDPVGDWTIQVSDQGNPDVNGSFLGWNMMFWGSAIDPDEAYLYTLPPDDHNALPPADEELDHPTPSTTTSYIKPGSYLTDHPASSTSSSSASPTMTKTPPAVDASTGNTDNSPGTVVSSHKYSLGGLVLVILVGIAGGVYFWKRRKGAQQGGSEYTSLAEDGRMMSVESHPLVSSREVESEGRRPEGLGYHSAFLDDDEPNTAATGYRDEPERERS